jgi:hypothetical protein
MDGDPLKTLILFGALLLSTPLYAAQLNLELGANSRTWQTEELLKHPQIQTITIPNDVSYKKDMSYRAVPLAALLTGINPDDHLQAVALDGLPPNWRLRRCSIPRAPAPGWRLKTRQSPGRHSQKASTAPDRFIWSGPIRGRAISARNNGRSKSPVSSAWHRLPSASLPCCRTLH